VGGSDDMALHALDCIGDCFLQRRDAGNAQRAFAQMCAISPRDQRCITGSARVAALSGDLAGAERMLDEIVDPRYAVYPPAYMALAEVQRAQNKIDEAIQSYRNIATMDGYGRSANIALAEIYRERGDYNNAMQAAQQAMLNSSPGDAEVRQLMDLIRLRQ
jgi:tetratricopeptide (TPR) repeat protein